ncbi:recombinase family protein [uncultured Clostridium sp.]|uniref:recombinase family protein n=1 Tax=uncultured Clostridium sp. TaxID=59620 RepID=UPI00261DBA0F|nr:recombinase family protein [uncultured Clostridium sp.]
MLKVGVYIRVSTDNVEQQTSLKNQRDLFIQYAKENKWSIYDFYVDIESGTSTKRKELNRLIKDAEARKINVLVAKELSRLARNVELSHKIKRIAETNNVHIVTLDGAINTLEGNGNMFGLYAWIYEQEAQRTSERIKVALRSRAELGLFNGSVAPYGYECIDSKLHIGNDDTPKVVRRIFSEYISGKGIDTIARHLYNDGIPTPAMVAGKSNKNDKWHGRTIQLILKNQAYLGHMVQLKQSTVSVVSKARYKTNIDKQAVIKNTHEPIISEEDFNLVQDLMKIRTHKNYHQALHLFTNTIYCSDCGKGMHYKKNRKGYVCGTFNKHGSKACSSHIVREANLSTIVLSEIKQFVTNIKTTDLYDNFKLEIDNEILKHKNALKSYEDDLIILKKRKSKSISMLIDEIITKSDYELFITDIDEQVKVLEHKIVITKQALEKISDSSLLNELNRIKNEELSLDELTPELLHRFVKKINIEEDGTPIISYRLIMPLPTLINN